MKFQMGNKSGFPKELKRLLTKKDPKSLGYLKHPQNCFVGMPWSQTTYVVSWQWMLKAYDGRQPNFSLWKQGRETF